MAALVLTAVQVVMADGADGPMAAQSIAAPMPVRSSRMSHSSTAPQSAVTAEMVVTVRHATEVTVAHGVPAMRHGGMIGVHSKITGNTAVTAEPYTVT